MAVGIERADAEALVAEQVAPNVIQKATQTSVALQTLPTVPMGSATMRMPVLSALPTGAFLTADQAVKPQSEAAWDKVYITAEELAVIVPISETVIADSSWDVVAVVTDLIAQEFARVIDAAIFFGTGAPATFPTGGLFGIASTAGQVVASTTDPGTDFNALFSELESAGWDPTDVYGARGLKSILRGMKDGQGTPIYNPLSGAVQVPSLYGVPLAFPLGWDPTKADAITVDEAGIVIGLRQDLTIKVLDQAFLTGFGSLAEKDSIAVRAVMRLGWQVSNPISLVAGARTYPVAALTPDITP
jgi:HK97 family phage major capsid protein